MDKGLPAGRRQDVGEEAVVAGDQNCRDQGRGEAHECLLPPRRGGHRRPAAAVMSRRRREASAFGDATASSRGGVAPPPGLRPATSPPERYSRCDLAGELVLDMGADDVVEARLARNTTHPPTPPPAPLRP